MKALKIVLTIFGVAVISCVAFFLFLVPRFDNPKITKEFSETLSEYRAMGLPWVASDLLQKPPVKLEENAAPLLEKAFADLPQKGAVADWNKVADLAKRGDWNAVSRALAPYQKSLREAEIAVKRPKLEWARDYDQASMMLIPELAQVHMLVRASCLFAIVEAHQRNAALSINFLQIAEHLTELTAQGPMAIDQHIALRMETQTITACEQTATILAGNPGDLEKLDRFEQEFKGVQSVGGLFPADSYFALAEARNWTIFRPSPDPDVQHADKIDPSKLVRDGIPTSPAIRASLMQAMKLSIAYAKLEKTRGDDLVAYKAALGRMEDPYDTKGTIDLSTNEIPEPATVSVETAMTTLARLRALKCLLAALTIKAKTGKWPTSIAAIPGKRIDPFTNKSLLIKATANGFRVYSVGPDLSDEGGVDRLERASIDDELRLGYDLVESYPAVVSARHPS